MYILIINMARRAPLTLRRILGNFFVLFALSVMFSIYYSLIDTFYPWCKISNPDHLQYQVILAIFHYFFLLIIICFFKTMLADPGTVPPLWGFHMGDSETKRKRYCLMCHVFKPERCHHCSACNRCVLNMDHHCRKKYLAWINNCVGFFNRKFFILLLFYVVICTYFITASLFSTVYSKLNQLILIEKRIPTYKEGFLLGSYLMNCILTVTLSFFFKFHLRLVLSNSTTIETMDKKVLNKTTFDKGTYENWVQVFGSNPWLWAFPLFGSSGKPIGDGVIWTLPGCIETDEIPADELDKRNSSTFEEQKKRKSDEEMIKEMNTAPDSNRLRIELKKPLNVHGGLNRGGKVKVFEDLIHSPG